MTGVGALGISVRLSVGVVLQPVCYSVGLHVCKMSKSVFTVVEQSSTRIRVQSIPSVTGGGHRHVQHVRPNMGPHKNGAPTKGQKLLQYSFTRLQFASERLASNCQSAAAAIVVCIAARVLNEMSMMTTVRVGPDSVG